MKAVAWVRSLMRSLPLHVKGLLVSGLVGGLFWAGLDMAQTRMLSETFLGFLRSELLDKARDDWGRLDELLRSQQQAVRLLAQAEDLRERFSRNAGTNGASGVDAGPVWRRRPPPWLSGYAMVRDFIHASHIGLQDYDGRVLEIFSVTPGRLTDSTLLRQVAGSHGMDMAIRDMDGVGVLITSASIPFSSGGAARLFMVTPFDETFLIAFQHKVHSNGIVAILDPERTRVIASGRPDVIPSGAPLRMVLEHHLLVDKPFLDYGVFSDTTIRLATLIPLEEIEKVGRSILSAERMQRTLGYAILIMTFTALFFWFARRVQQLTGAMVAFASGQLGLDAPRTSEGDQLHAMKACFEWMSREIVLARETSNARARELESTNTALFRTINTLRQAQEQLVQSEKMAALGDLVAGVAHEINTPLGVSLTAASELSEKQRILVDVKGKEGISEEELDDYLAATAKLSELVITNLNRTAELVRRFKAVAVDRSEQDVRSFNVRECIESTLVTLHYELKRANVLVVVQCPMDLEVMNQPGALSRILSNLVVNSLIHGFSPEDNGRIDLTVAREGDRVLMTFRDNGRGIPAKDSERVFEPFFTTSRDRGHTGLGLHIAFNLTTRIMGGEIRCEPSPEPGVLFRFTFPIFREAMPLKSGVRA